MLQRASDSGHWLASDFGRRSRTMIRGTDGQPLSAREVAQGAYRMGGAKGSKSVNQGYGERTVNATIGSRAFPLPSSRHFPREAVGQASKATKNWCEAFANSDQGF